MDVRPLRTCTLCRQRKVKCDRQQPCSNCTRAATECVYPAGLGRAPKRARKAVEARLLAQLSRLESVVKHMETHSPNATPSNMPQSQPEGCSPEIEQQFGRLVIDDMQSCYVSSAPWTQLGDEIDELRDLLNQPSSDDEEQPTITGLESTGSSSALFGFRALAHSLRDFHPQVHHAVVLFDTFNVNVAPLVRVFHMPTLHRLFWDAIASMDSLDKNIEALLFAIYYSAVISLDPSQCFDLLGISRASALEMYRFAVEQATARADLLNTQNLILLQATVLFLTALRNEDDSRTVWSLTSLVYHIAQAMGLHRDGEQFGLRPLETELRRRLWWHICLLDNRSTDYHGSEPIVHESIFDTKMPLNINDDDITAEMTQTPVEREGITEMTFCLMRCHAMRVVWQVGYMAPRSTCRSATAADNNLDSAKREALVTDLERLLQDRFLKHCDLSIPFLRLSASIARIITLRMWMAILVPSCHADETIRERLFTESIEMLEISNDILTCDDIRQWAWHSKTHVQWYSIAFLLAELCRRPPGILCDRAWECVSAVYERWSNMETEKKGPLWRAIRRLMARAKYVRELQKTASHSDGTGTRHRWRIAGESATPSEKEAGRTGSDDFILIPQSQECWPSDPTDDPFLDILPSDTLGLLDDSLDVLGVMLETNRFPGAAG
ncbi:putative C6 transcription factor [Aspergillus mulundensis]|uniref:Putative Zn(II)2Cys6 transcription factor n=1 Tax=Aspergillus mulundensis TaxID=1810919 RepID=A0A3D8QBA3_9EURO|nr:putative Zn(II)2Cys6 transcription factor [Aspergillus mulundensis]RDW58930.1 putative Zn(II)2Cys6 transcription factor [Aspergillus mulundensis]